MALASVALTAYSTPTINEGRISFKAPDRFKAPARIGRANKQVKSKRKVQAKARRINRN